MTTSTTRSTTDHFNTSGPALHPRVQSSNLTAATAPTPSPRTPLLGRSISSQFGSPSSFRSEQDDHIIYELGARHFSAGFSGESRPRCVLHFDPQSSRRLGDFRAFDPGYRRKRRRLTTDEEWCREYELYRVDLRCLDLGLVEDKLERAVRKVHLDFLQLDTKPRKVCLVVPSLLPTPLLDVALRVLFTHTAQPPQVKLLTTPLLACVGAGLRNALVVDVGWEECVVTAVGEYKEVFQRRSGRAGRAVTMEMSKVLQSELEGQRLRTDSGGEDAGDEIDFELAEEVTQRMGWCNTTHSSKSEDALDGTVAIPIPSSNARLHMPFTRLSEPAETALFTASDITGDDDHNLPLHNLAYRVLLALPVDLRGLCVSRIVVTGGISNLPGLQQRLLQELTTLIEARGWDVVHSYGSATANHKRVLQERSTNIVRIQQRPEREIQLSPAKRPLQDDVPHADRIHDDKYDEISRKAEREANKVKDEELKPEVRGVKTLGAWAGASLITSMKVKGAHEFEREEFLKNGLRDTGVVF